MRSNQFVPVIPNKVGSITQKLCDLLHKDLKSDDIKWCLANGADVDGKETDSNFNIIAPPMTPLMIAIAEGNLNYVYILLEAKAKIDATNNVGDTALIYTAKYNQPRIADVLLNAKANINHRGAGGNTALMVAIKNRHLQMVNLLQCHYPDMKFFNSYGETALAVAEKHDQREIVQAVKKHQAFIDDIGKEKKVEPSYSLSNQKPANSYTQPTSASQSHASIWWNRAKEKIKDKVHGKGSDVPFTKNGLYLS